MKLCWEYNIPGGDIVFLFCLSSLIIWPNERKAIRRAREINTLKSLWIDEARALKKHVLWIKNYTSGLRDNEKSYSLQYFIQENNIESASFVSILSYSFSFFKGVFVFIGETFFNVISNHNNGQIDFIFKITWKWTFFPLQP